MKAVRRSAVVLALLMVLPVTAHADPAGTVVLNGTPTDKPIVGIRGASPAGLWYDYSNSDYGGVTSTFVKPTGQPAVPVDQYTVQAIAGSMLFRRVDDRIYYRTLPSGTEHSCAIDSGATLAYLPTGWLAKPYNGDTYTRVTAATSGCTTTTLTTIPNSRLVTADETGFVIEVTTPQTYYDLTYLPYSDLNPRLVEHNTCCPHNGVATSGGVVAWPATVFGQPPYHTPIHRWTEAGGDTAVAVDGYIGQVGLVPGLTAFLSCPTQYGGPGCVTGTVPAAGGAATTVPDSPGFVADGTNLYVSRFGDSSGIDRGTSLSSLTRILTVPKVPPGSFGIALGASRLGYIDTAGTDSSGDVPPYNLHWRYAAKSGGKISLLPAHDGGTGFAMLRMDGRRQVLGRTGMQVDDGSLRLRTEGGADANIFTSVRGLAIWVSGKPPEISGSRVLWYKARFINDPCNPSGCPQYGPAKAMLYDIRTGASTELGDASTTKWALWGSYVVWATKDGSIYRRDLSSSKTVTVKSKGYGVIGLGVWGSYVGWSECVQACFKGNIAYRNLATMAAPVRVPTPVVALEVRVTGGHVVYGISDGPSQNARWLREVRIGSTATATIGEYLYNPSGTMFAAHDEVLAWIGRYDALARVAPNSAYVDPPKFLGNALGPSSFKAGTTWSPEYAISKALPTCQLVIRSKTTGTVLKRLACASSTGSAHPSWNGRLDSGALVPRGSYSWTLTGSDSDGALRWWTGATTPITGSVTVL